MHTSDEQEGSISKAINCSVMYHHNHSRAFQYMWSFFTTALFINSRQVKVSRALILSLVHLILYTLLVSTALPSAYAIQIDCYASSSGGSWNGSSEADGVQDDLYATDEKGDQDDLFLYSFDCPSQGTISELNLSLSWYQVNAQPGSNPDLLALKYSDDSGTSWYNPNGTAYDSGTFVSAYPLTESNQTYLLDDLPSLSDLSSYYLGIHGIRQGSADSNPVNVDAIWMRLNYSPVPTGGSMYLNASKVFENDSVIFNTTWSDDDGLSHFVFEVDQNGSWWNSSNISIISPNASRYTVVVGAEKGSVVKWRFHANDSDNAWNATEVQEFTVQNSIPSFRTVWIQSNISPGTGAYSWVTCNGSAYDKDDEDDMVQLHGRLYHSSKNYSDDDDARNHYSNSSCTILSKGNNLKEFMCGFYTSYSIRPGYWYCNLTVMDGSSGMGWMANMSNVSELWAFNLTPSSLAYQNLSPGNNTEDVEMVLENIGNMPVDLSLYGYGAEAEDELAMNCSNDKSIPISYQRYSAVAETDYGLMDQLSGTAQEFDFNLGPMTSIFDGQKRLYWKMGSPISVTSVNCSGIVMLDILAE